ncbi:uncharacterized protein G2W53_032754 [Senna tora]|uniref:Uncharacterized protein n=1 Tax=Senna tora TaxID=362788 RepID=A0A834SWG8_9FABA|nr:uncharacterized protein G2W53_032754 [Senna tora]
MRDKALELCEGNFEGEAFCRDVVHRNLPFLHDFDAPAPRGGGRGRVISLELPLTSKGKIWLLI